MGMFFNSGYFGQNSNQNEFFDMLIMFLFIAFIIAIVAGVIYLIVKMNKNNEDLNRRLDYIVEVLSRSTSINEINRKYDCLALLDEVVMLNPIIDKSIRHIRYELFLSKVNLCFSHDQNLVSLITTSTSKFSALEASIDASNYSEFDDINESFKIQSEDLNKTLLQLKELLMQQIPKDSGYKL